MDDSTLEHVIELNRSVSALTEQVRQLNEDVSSLSKELREVRESKTKFAGIVTGVMIAFSIIGGAAGGKIASVLGLIQAK